MNLLYIEELRVLITLQEYTQLSISEWITNVHPLRQFESKIGADVVRIIIFYLKYSIYQMMLL